MQDTALAAKLLDRARHDQQSAHRLQAGEDVDAVRREIRRIARSSGTKIRTAILDDVLVVVLADAEIWSDPASIMREKLGPPTP